MTGNYRTRIYDFFSLGICQRPGICLTIATRTRCPKGTDHCSTEEYRCTHVDVCVCGKILIIVSMCVVLPVVHTSNIFSCKKTFLSFPLAVNNSIKVGALVFLL
jgi:hypothetical protein